MDRGRRHKTVTAKRCSNGHARDCKHKTGTALVTAYKIAAKADCDLIKLSPLLSVTVYKTWSSRDANTTSKHPKVATTHHAVL